jgi:hypothetical protein
MLATANPLESNTSAGERSLLPFCHPPPWIQTTSGTLPAFAGK